MKEKINTVDTNKSKMLSTAIAFAAEMHKNQFDKSGMPYILHTLKVMHYLKTDDIELMCIGVLHDVIEDCHVTDVNLRNLGMTERVISGVIAMTRKNKESEEAKFIRLSSNKDAVLVKLCDLRHNMDIRRLKGVQEKDLKRMNAYCELYTKLKGLA